MPSSASNFTFLSMPSLLPRMSSLNTAANPQSSFKCLLKTHSSSNVKCKQCSENSSPDGLLGLWMSSSLSLSLHPHESSHLKLGWWIYYHPTAIPIFGRECWSHGNYYNSQISKQPWSCTGILGDISFSFLSPPSSKFTALGPASISLVCQRETKKLRM